MKIQLKSDQNYGHKIVPEWSGSNYCGFLPFRHTQTTPDMPPESNYSNVIRNDVYTTPINNNYDYE